MASLSDTFNQALAAFSRGDLTAARAQGETLLKKQPKNAAVLQLLGVIDCQAGNFMRGAGYFRMAMRNGADTADNRVNLAKALLETGGYDEALKLCEGPFAEGSAELQRMKADILKAQGRPEVSVQLYERLVHEQPEDFDAWNNLGNARHAAGDLEGALAALQQARLLNDTSSLVFVNLGRLMISMDRNEDACFMLEKAALLAPEDPAPLLELGRALTSIDHPEAGLRALGAAARLDSKNPRIFVAMGQAFADMSDQQKAEQALRFALQADPAFPPALLNLGIVLEKANRLDDLTKLLAHAEARGVDNDDIRYLRALALSRQGKPEEALELARTIQTNSLHPTALSQFVGQLADRLGRIDEAYAAFEEMNRAMAKTPLAVNVDRSAYQRNIERNSSQTTAEWFARWPDAPLSGDRPSPAFLVGFPRSGTTLLDTMLMGHSGTHVLEEVPIIEEISQEIRDFTRIAEMGADEVASLRALYFEKLDKVATVAPGKLVIDKNPLSMIRVPLIHRLFPDAKIILAMRHPCDVVLSCYMQNFKPTEAMASFLDLTNASRTYDRIFAYWEKCREIFPIDVAMLRYEDMIADPEAVLRPLFGFLGLGWEASAVDHRKTATERGFIRTPSYAQVTEGLYKRASGRWVRYREPMRYALPVLAPWVERYGYSLEQDGEPAAAVDMGAAQR